MTSRDDDLDQLLTTLRLPRIRAVIDQELARAEKTQPSYRELVARLLREEVHALREQRTASRVRRAKLPESWTLETFPFERQPGVSAAAVKQLAELSFMERRQNLVLIGPTGVGKTGIAMSLLRKAVQNGYRGRFIKAPDLFDELWSSVADRSSRKLLDHLARLDLLAIDEMGYLNLRPEQSNLFFKLMEERYNRRSTIVTTNLDYDAWYGFLGQKEMVGALLDRLRHHCVTLRIDGPSLRTPDV
jgi:DNA replication protein DnaC